MGPVTRVTYVTCILEVLEELAGPFGLEIAILPRVPEVPCRHVTPVTGVTGACGARCALGIGHQSSPGGIPDGDRTVPSFLAAIIENRLASETAFADKMLGSVGDGTIAWADGQPAARGASADQGAGRDVMP